MRAHFINAGQADVSLLGFRCGAILIDAGARDDTFEAAFVKLLADSPDVTRTLLGGTAWGVVGDYLGAEVVERILRASVPKSSATPVNSDFV
jgi:hypothetical protein